MAATITGDTWTTFLSTEWIPDGVTSVYDSITATGQCTRSMYDERIEGWAWYKAWCFEPSFTDDDNVPELIVN